MVFDLFNLVEAFWIIIPAYAANGLVPWLKGKHPVDFGKTLKGEPIFGPGKTWEGLIGAGLIGALFASIQMLAYPYLPWSVSLIPLLIIPMTPVLGFFIGFGALFGDLVKSFFKRRIGIKRGAPLPVFDQIDFILGGYLFASFLVPVQLSWVILFVVITPVFHLMANFIAYFLKVKKDPW